MHIPVLMSTTTTEIAESTDWPVNEGNVRAMAIPEIGEVFFLLLKKVQAWCDTKQRTFYTNDEMEKKNT